MRLASSLDSEVLERDQPLRPQILGVESLTLETLRCEVSVCEIHGTSVPEVTFVTPPNNSVIPMDISGEESRVNLAREEWPPGKPKGRRK